MSMTNPVFQDASVYPKKYGREALLPGVGQDSRAIIPGDDPGDQQPPERAITKGKRSVRSSVPDRVLLSYSGKTAKDAPTVVQQG